MGELESEDAPITERKVKAAWLVASVAVAVVLFVGGAYVVQRVDQAETRKDIEAMSRRFDATDKRIDESNQRLDRIEGRVDKAHDVLSEIKTAVEVLKERTRPKEPGR